MQPVGELERKRPSSRDGGSTLPKRRPPPPGGAERRHRLSPARILVPRTGHDPATGDAPLGRRARQPRRPDHDRAARPEREDLRARRARLRSGQAAILVRGDRARITGNDISGPGYRNRNTPCILLDGPRDVLIEANRIHNCARVSRRNLYAPGILVSSALRTQIRHNVVYHTLGDGIALAPNAQRSRVTRNIVDGNTSGIYIGGGPRTASSYNVVTRNVISNSGRWNVHAAWSGRTGKGNVVASNCLWNGFGGNSSGGGFRLVGNIKASPRFRNRPHDFGMRTGPCLSMHPRIVRISRSVLPAFRVGYRLRALPDRVQIVRLTLTGLTRGTHLSLRCTSRCGTRWTGRASSSTLALPVLRGAWLARGATVEVRATRGGWIGHVARVVVTGLPRGVKVVHGRTS